jgi:hypothetical protein
MSMTGVPPSRWKPAGGTDVVVQVLARYADLVEAMVDLVTGGARIWAGEHGLRGGGGLHGADSSGST